MLTCILHWATSFAQETFWNCNKITDDLTAWNEFDQSYGSNKKRAKELCKTFTLNSDGGIEQTYIIQGQKPVEREIIIGLIKKWIATNFTNNSNVIKECTENHIRCQANWGKVAFYQVFIDCTIIQAQLEINIYIKEDRLKFVISTPHYILTSASGGFETKVIAIANTFPYKKDSDHKESYSMAFLNTFSSTLTVSKNFITFLNAHINDNKKNDFDDW